ncbi:MAG: HdeD family acid-resistance protein [Paracoccaceae bacterium]
MTIPSTPGPLRPMGKLTAIGLFFVVLGLLATALPAWATIAVEQLVAVLLLVWGAAGLGFGLSLRPNPEWRMTTALFVLVLALGMIFLVFPQDGVQTMTMLLIAVYLIQGAASISVGLGLRGKVRAWGLLLLSGVASLVLGLLILTGWPGTAAWTLGMLTGLNFLANGIALILLGRDLSGAGRS